MGRLSFVFLVFSLFVLSIETFADEYKLEWNLKKDTTYQIKAKMKMKQTIKSEALELDEEQDIIIDDVEEFIITDEKDDKYTISHKIKKLSFSIKAGQVSFSYDSEKDNPEYLDENDEVQTFIKAMAEIVGSSFSYDLTKSGKTDNFSFGKITNPQVIEMISESLKNSFMTFPDKKIKVNDTWEEKIAKGTPPLGKLVLIRKYTLKEVKDNKAYISVSGSAEWQLADNVPEDAAKIKEFKVDGEIIYSLDLQRVVSGKVKSLLSQDLMIFEGNYLSQVIDVEAESELFEVEK